MRFSPITKLAVTAIQPDASLQLRGVTKRFGAFTAVHPLNLTIKGGQMLALLGPSGCGKTTTLRMIAGFEQPDQGHVLIAGRDVTLLRPAKRRLGMVFQNYSLFPHMTVAQNVAFGLRMQHVGREPKRRWMRARGRSWTWSSSHRWKTASRASFPAASNSASPLRGH